MKSIHNINFEIYENNLDGYMTWDQSVKACDELGDGWRLPTLRELKDMYELHLNKKIEFGNYGCWSSTIDDVNDWVWSKGFHTGNEYLNPRSNLNLVRPVRTIKKIEKEYWVSLTPPLSPSEKDVKIFEENIIEGTTLLLGCTKELIHLTTAQMDLEPFDFVPNPIVANWVTNQKHFNTIIGDGVLNFTKELCDDILHMCSNNCDRFIVRCFNRKMDTMRIANYFPNMNMFSIRPRYVQMFADYTFYIWDFKNLS